MKRTRYSKSHVFAATITALSTLLIGCRMEGSHELTSPRPVPFSNIIVADEFWAPRIETNRTVTIPHDFRKCEETGRIDNFAKAGGSMKGKFEGIRFNDSDVFKVIEGAAYSLSTYPDPNLSEYLDSLITKIAAAQENDGYLYTCRTIDPNNLPKDAGQTRWLYLISSHELYSVGHLYEAAVAHYRATGKRTLLDVAIKNADLIDRTFGPGKKRDVPGHQEIEIGLVKLSRLTGNEKYLKLAKFFLDQRGRPEGHHLYGKYSQDHKPVIDQNEAVGHAVRAGYMYCAMGDVALLTGDQAYIKALDLIWEDVVSKKLYLTGGIGARGSGESFGSDYELPNKTAYCETCAAIANAMWNYRMFLLHRDAKYIDVLERVIYNGFLSGVSMKGDEFFYQNPLENAGDYQRSPWFGCACCPPNVARFIPSLPGYAYTQQNDDLYVNLFIGGNAIIRTNNNTVYLKQQTRYPLDGNVEITVEPTRSQEFAVYIRIPGWAQNRPVPSDLYRYLSEPASDGFGELGRDGKEVMLKVNGSSVSLDINNGYSRIRRKWEKGDIIELELPMPIQRVLSHQNVKDNL
ncbi:MAG: glycoside hydrolase family 127 protein, partial [Planctomycetota bacterium]|nr:glycoside hydrolase family 127 protein [Planctomycetota bacterium]